MFTGIKYNNIFVALAIFGLDLLITDKNNRRPPSLLADHDEPALAPKSVGIPRASRSRFRSSYSALAASIFLGLGTIVSFSLALYEQESATTIELMSSNAPAAGQHVTLDPDKSTPLLDSLPVVAAGAIIIDEHTRTPETEPMRPELPTQPPTRTASAPAGKKITTPIAQPAESTPVTAEQTLRSSDVDFLLALMRYSEDEQSLQQIELQERLGRCPAANTEEGIWCRQQICRDLGETVTLCPAPGRED